MKPYVINLYLSVLKLIVQDNNHIKSSSRRFSCFRYQTDEYGLMNFVVLDKYGTRFGHKCGVRTVFWRQWFHCRWGCHRRTSLSVILLPLFRRLLSLIDVVTGTGEFGGIGYGVGDGQMVSCLSSFLHIIFPLIFYQYLLFLFFFSLL